MGIYRKNSILRHPTRPDVEATYGIDETDTICIEIGVVDSPLFEITTTASTDVELFAVLALLVDTGFFERRDLLHALRWTEWFQPDEIHDPDVRRAAEVVYNLKQITFSRVRSSDHDDGVRGQRSVQ